jgi:[amino group carrier protein]-lysine/ornithine hydrolase
MLEIYSPSGSETELATLILREMKSNGISASLDDAGNVIGRLGNEGPRVLLCGHMDTVPGRIPVRWDGNSLYGRGAVDAKSSLAAMILGAKLAMERAASPIQITVAGVVEEETTSRGIRALMNEHGQYDLAVFGEPSGVSNMIIGYKGSLKLHFSFHTAGGHSASPWLSTSSYEEASAFWDGFRREILSNDAQSKFDAVTGCVTNLAAGGPGNNVPSDATVDIDVRIPPTLKSSDLVTQIRRFISRYGAAHERVKTDLRVDDQTEAFVASSDSTVLSAFRWAIRSIRGGQVALVKKTGTSDMNLFAETQNVPMFAYGPGDSRLDHTGFEHVEISEYLACIDVYANALSRLAERTESSQPLPTAPR